MFDKDSPMWRAEEAQRPTWRTESTAATLASGLAFPCVTVFCNTAGTYRCYLAGNYPDSQDLYLREGETRLALWKITGGPDQEDQDATTTTGNIAFGYPR